MNRVAAHTQSQIVYYLMNICMTPTSSPSASLGRDSAHQEPDWQEARCSPWGWEFARSLALFMSDQDTTALKSCTSQMQKTPLMAKVCLVGCGGPRL